MAKYQISPAPAWLSALLALLMLAILVPAAQALPSIAEGSLASITVSASGNDGNYRSIQEAIDAAAPGSRIDVGSGIYFENLIVDRRVSLFGSGSTVIDGQQKGSAVTITADGVLVEGFAIRNSSLSTAALREPGGIRLQSNDNTIRNNTITDNWNGIVLISSHENIICNNSLAGGQEAIDLRSSHNNTICHNRIVNAEDGILLEDSRYNSMSSNTILDCSDDGLICINGSHNIIEGNKALRSGWHGLELFFSDNNTMINNEARGCKVCNIFIVGSDTNRISENLANSCEMCGIWCMRSRHNLISGNAASRNNYSGIRLDESEGNTVAFNEACSNQVAGIEALSSNGNSFYGNNLSANLLYPAYDDGENRWGDPERPNRYSDFDEPSEGCFAKHQSGICDQIYLIEGSKNTDSYPGAK